MIFGTLFHKDIQTDTEAKQNQSRVVSKEMQEIRREKKRQIHRTIQIEMLKIKSCLWLLALLGTNNVKKIAASEYVCVMRFVPSRSPSTYRRLKTWIYGTKDIPKENRKRRHSHTYTHRGTTDGKTKIKNGMGIFENGIFRFWVCVWYLCKEFTM